MFEPRNRVVRTTLEEEDITLSKGIPRHVVDHLDRSGATTIELVIKGAIVDGSDEASHFDRTGTVVVLASWPLVR